MPANQSLTDMNTTTAPKVALITGITGQDASYLAELLLKDANTPPAPVFDIARRTSIPL